MIRPYAVPDPGPHPKSFASKPEDHVLRQYRSTEELCCKPNLSQNRTKAGLWRVVGQLIPSQHRKTAQSKLIVSIFQNIVHGAYAKGIT